ncbi:hypothetical protein GCM10011363_38610 [Marivita lacus]|jgi:multidrug transporter EmrE-like cation transporter|uniref:5-aminolevulinate synthase n=1 Tax=Marivita lacus TaxID=1323742 RepID=A0ABQ1L5Q9_9RHOB|nr:5-aminolevulinate synthase [Marivita lacus]GGC18256.1 hypothetical protein GCM10011363_38610 [Marivita lacus]
MGAHWIFPKEHFQTVKQMLVVDLFSNKTFLVIAAGLGYAVATILMKIASHETTTVLIGTIAIVLAAVVTAEILLLRQVDLGLAYIAIMATETLLVLGAAYFVGQPLSGRELAGGALVLAGVAIVSF